MSAPTDQFTGTWLDSGSRRGKDFSHNASDYDHTEDGATQSKPMRHAFVEQEGGRVGVWVPQDWTDEQVREALESNW